MLIESIPIGAAFLRRGIYNTDKSLKMDEKALEKYAKAFEKQGEAEALIRKKAEYTDKRLMNVAKKKRSVIEVTVPKFVSVYSKIQKVEIENKSNTNELVLSSNIENTAIIQAFSLSKKAELTNKQLVCGILFKGITGLMVNDSERYMSAANNQMRSARVAYSQAQSIGELYDAIAKRSDRIAKLIMAMNALFIRSINETDKTIEKNGFNIRNYSTYDKEVLRTCVNIASAMSDIINIPVVDEDGEVYEAANEMIEVGEKRLAQINEAIQM